MATCGGFSFSAKTWGVVVVGDQSLRSVNFNRKAFDQLVLDPSRKRLLRAVVKYGDSSKNSACDIIQGKGEGTVFLFYGPPGVGKTLTAEAIADVMKKPLFQVSVGELGVNPSELEKNLRNVLDMCSRWGAIVLLDEADIFVERRASSSGIVRNAMVSVMLRLIEYFSGTLILTTNRATVFDPALQTRITVALKYDELTESGRSEVWRNLICNSGHSSDLKENGGDVDVDELAKHNMNGRNIKNALRLSLALASLNAEEKGEGAIVLQHDPMLETVRLCVGFSTQLSSESSFS